MTSEVEKKLDEVLYRLENIERLLMIGEDIPEEDELKVIDDYLRRKSRGEVELVPMEEALDEL